MPETNNKARELLDEFRTVAGKVGLLDTILPPILFLLLNGLAGFTAAMIGSLGMAFFIAILRLRRKQSLVYALAGMGSVGLAIALALLLGLTIALALVSLLIRKPMVAWTSYLARRWPLNWYWHARVRPAYTEVTLAWIVFFALRLFWQVTLYQVQDVSQLALVNTLTGWPATVILLILSYLYGTWRLATLRGPSVDEFRNNIPAPWQSQRQGF
jgi:MFS family permease